MGKGTFARMITHFRITPHNPATHQPGCNTRPVKEYYHLHFMERLVCWNAKIRSIASCNRLEPRVVIPTLLPKGQSVEGLPFFFPDKT